MRNSFSGYLCLVVVLVTIASKTYADDIQSCAIKQCALGAIVYTYSKPDFVGYRCKANLSKDDDCTVVNHREKVTIIKILQEDKNDPFAVRDNWYQVRNRRGETYWIDKSNLDTK